MKIRAVIFVLFMGTLLGCHYNSSSKSSDAEAYSIVYSLQTETSRNIYINDDSGHAPLLVANVTLSDGYPDISPNGKQVVFYGKYDNDKTWSIHTVNIDGSEPRRLTHKKHVWDSAPSWSPDGKLIVFAREYKDKQGNWQEEIWLMNADGREQRQIKDLEGRAAEFMPDGRLLYQSKAGDSQIMMSDIHGGDVIQLTNSKGNNMSPKLSPNGKHIVFLSNRDGNQEVYTMNIDGTSQRRMTFNQSKSWDPAWSADGKSFYFVTEAKENTSNMFKMSKDGTSVRRIPSEGYQIGTIKYLDKLYLERLIQANRAGSLLTKSM